MSNYKLRLKAPSGAEFEAEGPADFIQSEKACFLQSILAESAIAPQAHEDNGRAQKAAGEQKQGFWDKIITVKNGSMNLRLKSPGIRAAEAALILLAANRALNQSEDLSAIVLSRALRTSGYQPDRIDRLLSREIRAGKATASGTKRNRTYRITQRGLEAIYGAISRLTEGG